MKENNTNPKQILVHFILSHSYLVYLYTVILGFILDMVIEFDFMNYKDLEYVGAIFILAGTVFAYWAQHTSRHNKKTDSENKGREFARGPYKYTRSPTHLGLFTMTLGLGLISHSFFIIILALIAFSISKLFFLPKEEKLLEEKYGQAYCMYKNSTKF